MGQSNIIAEYH